MQAFLEQIAEILEVETINPTDELESFDEWDSLSILSIIALCSEEYGVELTNAQIKDANTVQGLYDLVKK